MTDLSIAKRQIEAALNKIRAGTRATVKRSEMEKTAEEAIRIIRRRTLLGYGVRESGGTKYPLKSIRRTEAYERFRERFAGLSENTTPKRHNLTLTGQLLDSLKVISSGRNDIVIGPRGARSDTDATNEEIAGYQANLGRKFMALSRLEFNQLLRFYRRTFTDLLRRVGVRRRP